MGHELVWIGAVVIDLSCPGWHISPENVSSMCQQLSADDIRFLPAKGRDGKYHVPGKPVTADREEVRRLFTEVLPLLRGRRGEASKFLFSPL
jgi:hypothetical protein